MHRQRIFGSLSLGLALSCSGKILTVDTGTGGSVGEDTGGSVSQGTGASGAVGDASLPCDLFEADGHPCVAAHSTVRRLRSGYAGPLYQVCKGAVVPGPSSCEGEAKDILSNGAGYADAAAQEEFCADEECSITIVYDQSGRENHLEPSPSGSAKNTPGKPAKAADLPTTVNGHEVFGMLFKPGIGYRAGCSDCTRPTGEGTARDDEPETVYMVTSAHELLNGCCFDYGNASTTQNNDGNGSTAAVYFGQGVVWGSGTGEGPWVMADLENGLYPGWENRDWSNISTNLPLAHDFVTAVLVGDTHDKNNGKGRFALYGGDAQSGDIATMYDGIRPERPGYVPMLKQGSIVLGIASDNSNSGGGRFYEGALVSGAVSKDTLEVVQKAIGQARYGK